MRNPTTGILLKLGSVFLFTCMGAILKATAEEVPPGEQVFFRSLFAVPVILAWLVLRRELATGLRTANPMSHAYRGIVGTISMGCGFAGLGLLPFPEATALNYAMPLMTVIFAAMFLNEDVRLFRLSMVGIGLTGVLIVLSPQLALDADPDPYRMLGAVVAFGGALTSALAQLFIRKLVQDERTSAIVFWFSFTSTVLGLTTLPFGWIMPDTTTAMLLVGSGILGGVAQILLTSAYRLADASLVAPFEYVSMLLAIAIGWYVFAEAPTPVVLIGAALVIGAGIAIIWRERQLGLERNPQRKAMTPPG